MKKLHGSMTARIIAIILLLAVGLATAASGIGVIALAKLGVYTEGIAAARASVIASLTNDAAWSAVTDYEQGQTDLHTSSNFRYVITDKDGKTVYSDYNNENCYPAEEINGWGDSSGYICTARMLKTPVSEDRTAITLRAFDLAASLRFALIVFAGLGVILCLALFIFLLRSAGLRNGTDEIVLSPLGKLPFDFYTFLALCAAGIFCAALDEFGLPEPVMLALALICIGLIVLHFFMTLSAKLKKGSLIRGSLCYTVGVWLVRQLKRFFSFVSRMLMAVPLLGRWIFVILGVLFVELIYLVIMIDDGEMLAFGWFVERGALVLLLLYGVLCFKKLRDGGKAIASGDTAYHIDTSHMKGELLAHANDLNSISLGVQSAVQEQMKSERLRTELITNVSHDIKTPLTSIISYVDLLEKEQPENEKSREYLEVLSRQSAKLKKLIEDLIEASKASTGTLDVSLTRCDGGVLLSQVQGEYADRLEKAGLELVISLPEEQVCVMADGRHIYRVFDNLMNNICKYAQRGTRVYVSLREDSGSAVFSFKNVSATPLDLAGGELKERFVRGDSSRSTEGSGLGLSIAESLLKLQNGTLDIEAEADLFKATVKIPSVK